MLAADLEKIILSRPVGEIRDQTKNLIMLGQGAIILDLLRFHSVQSIMPFHVVFCIP